MKLTCTAVCSILVAVTVTAPAFAALGGDATSVQADLVKIKGALRITSSARFTVHEITTSYGTVVREYVSPDGKVFGVAWQGPFLPELKQILGSYLKQYSAGVAEQRANHPGHGPLSVRQPGLVVETSGHMRAYYGRAFVPGLVPQGVDAGEVR